MNTSMAADDSVKPDKSQLMLIRELYSLLSWHMHHRDKSPRDTLNRLIFKGCGIELDKAPIRIWVHYYQLPDLMAIRQDKHEGANPKNPDAPPIIFINDEGEYLLDGQKRINLWNKIGATQARRCLMVSRKGRKNVM